MGLLYVRTSDGRKKPSIWVWLTLLAIMLGISILLVTNTANSGMSEISHQAQPKEAPKPVQKDESEKATGNMDTALQNEMDSQIKRETADGNGYIDPDREKEIRNKYEKMADDKQKNNFTSTVGDRLKKLTADDAPKQKNPTSVDNAPLEKTKGYKTFAERMKEEGAPEAGTSSGKSMDFGEPKPKETVITAGKGGPTDNFGAKPKKSIKNIMPLGTFIPCVLDGDIVTNVLQSHVWANVVLDVTFRRQLQLPKGLVRIRGSTATQPVQNVVDVHFDTMVFSDGTELPIAGFGYAAFDPRYPHRFRTRGVPGELIVPPMWVKIQSLIYTAALGASDAYIQNYIQENQNDNSTLTPTPSVDPITGQTTITYTQQSNSSNQKLGPTLALGAGQKALESLVEEVQKDLAKYQPYLIVEKGTPLFVQLDETVDVESRQINGTSIALEEEMKKNAAAGGKQTEPTYPPGDARAKYVPPTTDSNYPSYTPNGGQDLNRMQQQFNNLQSTLPQSGAAVPSPQNVQNLLNN